MRSKPAFSLIELLVSLVIISVIAINSMIIYKEFFQIQNKSYHTQIQKLELLNTKYFLQQNIQTVFNTTALRYENENLYFNQSLLLTNISSFHQNIKNNQLHIKICLNRAICQRWVINP